MSYQVLARKWRPQNFRQMVGQEHVLKALIHALESQRLHHAYLFTGTRGVGKTTIGRILAKCLSCHEGITAEPCGECGACQGIAEGRYVDLIEIDAASRTKVEDMRELLDNVQYAPTEGRFKIYLIDEVHMLSASSFNALLKTLEEPPGHVKFLFATTDPQKLPVTILSRCLQFNLKNMAPERIVAYLKQLLPQEKVEFEEAALWSLARAADGSMRDALSLTDQAIAYGNHALSESSVSAMLGTVDQKKIYSIIEKLISRDTAAMLAEVKALAEYSPDYASVLATLASVLHRVAIEQMVPGATDNAMGDQQQIVAYAKRLCAEDLQLFYQIALVSRKDLAMSPDPKAALEMALLRMMAFQMTPPTSEVLPDLPFSGKTQEQPPESSPAAETDMEFPHMSDGDQEISGIGIDSEQAAPDITSMADAVGSDDPETKKKTLLSNDSDEAITADSAVITETLLFESEPALEESPSDEASNDPDPHSESVAATSQSDRDNWPALAAELDVSGMTRNLLFNMTLEQTGTQLKLYVDQGHFRLLTDLHEKRIRVALADHFGLDQVPEFIEGLMPGQETPLMWRERKTAEMREQAKQIILDDSNVQHLLEVFDGVLLENSIQAIGEIK